MSSGNDAVFQRRNKQIQDAIDGQNLKQALQLIEKRMKKGENTRFLKAWKANILFQHADETHHQRGIAETLELCGLDPPTTDLETLDILHQTLERLDGHAGTMRNLWERAAKTKPQDLDIQSQWFSLSFESGDWKSAQKAAMSLQINFPKARKYYFWAAFLSYLVSIDNASSDADRKLFGTLAYRMLSKAADSVPSDPKQLLSAPRAIQTAEELLLLIKVLEIQERHEEVIKILDSENLGLNSRIVQNDWNFIRVKLLSFEKAGSWAEGLSYVRSLLALPTDESQRKALQERDDWVVWNLLVICTRNLNNSETTAASQKFVDEFIQSEPRSRNAQLARLDLIKWRVESGELPAEELLPILRDYLSNNQHKLYCFVDVQQYLSKLGRVAQAEFVTKSLKKLEQGEDGDKSNQNSTLAIINALKLEYCFQLSPDGDVEVSTERVEDFVSRCLEAYRIRVIPHQGDSASTTIESQPIDDLCLLAAMSLIRSSGSRVANNWDQISDTILIRSAGILHRLVTDSPHNYQALLLLLRIYLRLGTGSLALKTFARLSVKHLQWETVAHNLYTRLATIHPHPAPPIEGAEYRDFDPQSALVQALTFYRNADSTTRRHLTSGLDHGSYANIEGSIELQQRLKQSVCRKMYVLEVRRMQRLVGGHPMGRYDDLAKDTSPVFDQRKFDAFINCEAPGKTTFEERMRLGPLPRENWIKTTQVTDRLFVLLKTLALQKPTLPEIEVPRAEDLLDTTTQGELTAAEVENTTAQLRLLTLASYLNGSTSIKSDDIDRCLAQTEEWLKSKLTDTASNDGALSETMAKLAISVHPTPKRCAPSWRYLHETYSTLETLKAIALLVSVALKKKMTTAKVPKDKVDRLSTLTKGLYENIRENARLLKSHIAQSGTLSTLIDDVVLGGGEGDDAADTTSIGKPLRAELGALLDTSALELFCGSLMESWEEALDGVLSVTL